ncbi:MAG: dihydroorotate dehydrogenase [Crenarchaeota archaeon]|nr:dihydroorotate dehydrogenase [Thermoproteota archaeon]
MVVLATEFCGLHLRNPLMNASGVLGFAPEHVDIMASWGIAAIVTKTMTLEPREGYPPPIVVELRNGGLLNAVGLANPGVDSIKELCERARALGLPLIVSVGGRTAREFAETAARAEDLGANALELNLSCPHAKGYGAEIGRNPRLVSEVCKAVCSTVKIPVVAKLGISDKMLESAGRALEAGCRGLTLINTVPAMAIDVYSAKPVLSNVSGGLSGPPIHPIAVKAVYDTYAEYGAEIAGCGGVAAWIDAAELILAGARVVQIGTALARGRGRDVVSRIIEGLASWLETLGFRSLDEVIGLAHRR